MNALVAIPATRADCLEGERPCPHVACRHHLLPDAKSGARLEDLAETCALDVAGAGDHTLDEVAVLLGGLSTERIRQIEMRALKKVRKRGSLAEWKSPPAREVDSGDRRSIRRTRGAAASGNKEKRCRRTTLSAERCAR